MSRSMMARCATLLVLAGACATRVDVEREQANLLERDRAWAAVASTSKNTDSVVAFWTDDARVVGPGQPTLEGKAAIKQMVAGSMAMPGFHVTWTPEVAVIAASGDIGYTRGTNEFTIPDSTGATTKMPGRYLTVWRKGADGVWRCVEDYSSPAPAPTAAK